MPGSPHHQRNVPFVDLRAQYESIKPEILETILASLDDASFVGGSRVRDFEEQFSEFLGGVGCVAVGNGTDAIEITLEALGLPAGSEVIVPANSFIATSEAVTRAGMVVRFCDVEEDSFGIDPIDLAARITPETSAVIAVHLYGQPADMAGIAAIANSRGLSLIEDAAQAHGARIGSESVGTIGDAATFSFYPSKNLGAYGDAGAIVSKASGFLERARMTANHGRVAKYDHEFEGRNSRMDAIQAAVLSAKLRHLREWTERRRVIARTYREGLEGVGDLVLPKESPGCRHVYHLYVLRTTCRDDLLKHLRAGGIGCGVHYPVALPRLAAYRTHPQHAENFRAVRMSSEVLSIPMSDGLTDEQVDRVISSVRGFFGER